MNTEHSSADRDLMNLAADAGAALTPVENPISMQITATAMQNLQALQPLQGMAFDRAYMNDQVEMHTQALTLLNDLLVPSATNAALRTQLMTIRASVNSHLVNARNIQQSISSDAGDGGDGGGADASDASADGDASDGATDGGADVAMDARDGASDASDSG